MEHIYKIYPKNKRHISGILPNRKQIIEPTVVKNLNRREFLRCMASGEVHAIVDGVEIPIYSHNYEEAEAIFDKKVSKKSYEAPTLTIIPNKEDIQIPVSDENNTIKDDILSTENSNISVETETDHVVENNTDDELVEDDHDDTIILDGSEEETESDIVISGYASVEADEKLPEVEHVTVSVQSQATPAIAKPYNSNNKHHGKHYGKNQNTQSNYSNHKKK